MARQKPTAVNQQKQALKPQFIITQAMLEGLYERNPTPAHYTATETGTAILLGCRIEPGPINLALESDQEGFQRVRLSQK